jgi:hypothetical protein
MLGPVLTSANDGRPVISGAGYDVGFPSPSQPEVSINTISAVEYRVDGGAWQPISTTEIPGTIGNAVFASELPLYDGDYSLEVRARNSAGIESAISAMHIHVTKVGPRPDYSPSAPAITASAQVNLTLGAPQYTQTVQISSDPSFTGAAWETYSPTMTVRLGGGDGQQTLYVRYRDSQGRESLAFTVHIQLDTTPPEGTVSRDPADPDRLIIQAHDDGAGMAEMGLLIGDNSPLWLPFQTAIQLNSIGGLANSPSLRSETPVSILFRDMAGNTSAPYAISSTGFAVYLPLIVR